ncbi:MAG: phage tail protein [Anaerolineales bacterium]|nr:phage tail protein [Anaerolineales bacterium]
MAEFRERPYSQFNFLVDLGTGDTATPQAGFQEVSGLGMEITVAEYRNGNERDNAPRKITGMYKVPDVTLKRGVIGALDLYEWLNAIRNGAQDQLRTVTIQLLSEDRATVAMEWKLTNARLTKYTGPSFNGKGSDVAVEEITLACERIDLA